MAENSQDQNPSEVNLPTTPAPEFTPTKRPELQAQIPQVAIVGPSNSTGVAVPIQPEGTTWYGRNIYNNTLSALQAAADSSSGDRQYLEELRAKNQTNWERFGNAVGGGLQAGLFRGIDAITSLVPYVGEDGLRWDPMSDDFSDRSMLSNWLHESAEGAQAANRIYSDSPYNVWEGMQSALTSIVEFALPGVLTGGIGKGVQMGVSAGARSLASAAGKQAVKQTAKAAKKGAVSSRSASSLGKVDALLTEFAKSPANKRFMQAVPAGILQNRLEGTIMGTQVYQETLDTLSDAVARGELTQEEAVEYANEAASSTRARNTAMMATDIFQMFGIFKAKGMTRNLLGRPGAMNRIYDKVTDKNFWNPLKHGADNNLYRALVEGGEEIVQSNIQNQAKYDALKGAEARAALNVGIENAPTYTYAKDDYFDRLKDNLFSKQALFEGLIGFFSGPIQSAALGSKMGAAPIMDRYKYNTYTKQINALQEQLKPGGKTVDPGQRAKVAFEIETLKNKRALETTKGFRETQQELIASLQDDVKRSFVDSVKLEEAAEMANTLGIPGLEALITDTAFINLATKHFQNGTTEMLERYLRDLAEGKLDGNSFGEDAQARAAEKLTELQEMEREWTRYYDYESSPEIFAAIQNRKAIENRTGELSAQQDGLTSTILEKLNNFDSTYNYSLDELGNLQATKKTAEEIALDEKIDKTSPVKETKVSDVKSYLESLPEYQQLKNVISAKEVATQGHEAINESLAELTTAEGQKKLKEERLRREAAAKKAAERARAERKSQVGSKSMTNSKKEKSAISNAKAKVENKSTGVATDDVQSAPVVSEDELTGEEIKFEQPAIEFNDEGVPQVELSAEPSSEGSSELEIEFAETKTTGPKKSTVKEPTVTDSTPDQDVTPGKIEKATRVVTEPVEDEAKEELNYGYSRASDQRSHTVQGVTLETETSREGNKIIKTSTNKTSDSGMWRLSGQVAEGDTVEFVVVTTPDVKIIDPRSTEGRETSIDSIRTNAKEIAEFESNKFGGPVTEEQVREDSEVIEIRVNGERVGYVGTPLSVNETRRNFKDEQGKPLSEEEQKEKMLEEKESLRNLRRTILDNHKTGATTSGKINSITPQFINYTEISETSAPASTYFTTDSPVGIWLGSDFAFKGGSRTIENLLGFGENELANIMFTPANMISGMPYVLVPMSKTKKNGTTITNFYPAPLIGQGLNPGFVNTMVFGMKAWSATDSVTAEESNMGVSSYPLASKASSLFGINLGKPSAKKNFNAVDKLKLFLERFTAVYTDKDVTLAEGETERLFLYADYENDSITLVKKSATKLGTITSDLVTIQKDKDLTEKELALLVNNLPALRFSVSKQNLQQSKPIPFVITDIDGNIPPNAINTKAVDYVELLLDNTVSIVKPVGPVLEENNAAIYHQNPKVTFTVNGEQKTQAPKTVAKPAEDLAVGTPVNLLTGKKGTGVIEAVTDTTYKVRRDGKLVTVKKSNVAATEAGPVAVEEEKTEAEAMQEIADELQFSPEPQVTQPDVVPQDEYDAFVNTGKVSDERLESIATKIQNNSDLSPNEMAIFADKTAEINELLRQRQADQEEDTEGAEDLGDLFLVGDGLSQEAKEELDGKRIKGLSEPVQREAVDFGAKEILRLLVEGEGSSRDAMQASTAGDIAYTNMVGHINKRIKEFQEISGLPAFASIQPVIDRNIRNLQAIKSIFEQPGNKELFQKLAVEQAAKIEMVKTLEDQETNGFDGAAPERTTHNDDFFLTLDPKLRVSRKLRAFLSTVPQIKFVRARDEAGNFITNPDGSFKMKPTILRNSFGAPVLVNYEEVFNKLHELQVGSSSSLEEQLLNLANIYLEFPGMQKELNWIPSLITRLGADSLPAEIQSRLDEAMFGTSDFNEVADLIVELDQESDGLFSKEVGEDVQNQFASNMSKAKVQAPLILYGTSKHPITGMVSFNAVVIDHNSGDSAIRIFNETQNRFRDVFYTLNVSTNVYEPNEEAFDRAINNLDELAKRGKEKDAFTSAEEIKQLGQDLENILGIQLSEDLLMQMADPKQGYKVGANLKLTFNGRNNLFNNAYSPFVVLKKALKSAKNKNFGPDNGVDQTNPINQTSIKTLLRREAVVSPAKMSNSFTVGNRTIYTFTEHNYATRQLMRLMDPNVRSRLNNTVFSANSLWSYMMSPQGNNLISTSSDLSGTPGISIEFLNFRPLQEFTESTGQEDFDQMVESDNYLTRHLLFWTGGAPKKAALKKAGKYEFGTTRRTRTTPLTYSDKSNMLTVNTTVPVFVLEEQGSVDKNTVELFYEHAVIPEIERIARIYDNDNVDDLAYRIGASVFHMFPALNEKNIVPKGGSPSDPKVSARELVIDRKGKLEKEEIAQIKEIVRGSLNTLVTEGMEDMRARNINTKAFGQENSFVPNSYLDTIRDAYKDVHGKEFRVGQMTGRAVAADYVLNQMISAANMFQLIAGDPALYTKGFSSKQFDKETSIKDTLDQQGIEGLLATTRDNIQKRLASVLAPGVTPAVSPGKTKYLQLFYADPKLEEVKTAEYLRQFPQEYRDGYAGSEIADAQEFITWREFLDSKLTLGEITKSEYNQLARTFTSGAELESWMGKILFEAQKPVAVVDRSINIGGGKSYNARTYVKSSGVPLIPQFTKGLDIDNLRIALEKVESNFGGLPVRLAAKSAVKVGFPSSAAANKIYYTNKDQELENKKAAEEGREPENIVGKFKKQDELYDALTGGIDVTKDEETDELVLDDNAPVQVFEREYWKIQQATPSKQTDEATRGTQESKHILSAIRSTFEQDAANDIINRWDTTHDRLFKIRKAQLEKKILNKDGTLNRKKLSKVLKQSFTDGGLDPNLEYGLNLDENGEFVVPLDLSTDSNRYQALINSLASKNIAKKKVKGQSTVLMTEFGFSVAKGDFQKSGILFTPGFDMEEGGLKPARIENGVVKPAQVVVPNKFFIEKVVDGKKEKVKVDLRQYAEKTEDGRLILDPNKVPKDVLEGFSFRIPTQGYSSLAAVEIVGFLPDTMGDVVVAPASFVAQMGSDFDIDKLFNYFPAVTTTPEGVRRITGKAGFDHRTADIDLMTGEELELAETLLLNDALDMRIEIMKNEKVYKIMSKPLSFGLLKMDGTTAEDSPLADSAFSASVKAKGLKTYFEERANNSSRLSDRTIISPSYQTKKYNEARGAKEAIGVFARVGTFNAMVQADLTNTIKTVPIKLGNTVGDMLTGVNTLTNRGRSKNDAIEGFLSSALDNEKEQIMNYLNVNQSTFAYISPMLLLGFEEDMILGFLETPILKLKAKYQQSRTQTFQESQAMRELSLKMVNAAMKYFNVDKENVAAGRAKKLFEGEGSYNDTVKRLFTAADSHRFVFTGKDFIVEIADSGSETGFRRASIEESNKILAYSLGANIVAGDLKAINTEVLEAQRYLNLDSQGGGIGPSADSFYGKIAEFQKTMFGREVPVTDIADLVGDARLAREGSAGYNNLENDPEFINLGVLPNSEEGLHTFLKPNTVSAKLFAQVVTSLHPIYQQELPLAVFSQEYEYMGGGAVSFFDRGGSASREKITKAGQESVRSVLFSDVTTWLSSTSADILGIAQDETMGVQRIRERLLYSKEQNMAALTQKALKSGVKELSNNAFLNTLILENAAGGRSKVHFPNYTGDNMNSDDMARAFSRLFTMKNQEVIEGTNITPADLGTLLITYSFVTGGQNKALEFTRYIPTPYLHKTGFWKALRNSRDAALRQPVRLARSVHTQLYQHNPTNSYPLKNRVKMTSTKDPDVFILSGRGVDIDQFGIYSIDAIPRLPFAYRNNTIYSLSSDGEYVYARALPTLGDKEFKEFNADFLNKRSDAPYSQSVVIRGEVSDLEGPPMDLDLAEGIGDIVFEDRTPFRDSAPATQMQATQRTLNLPEKGKANLPGTLRSIADSSDLSAFRELAQELLKAEEELKGVDFSVSQVVSDKENPRPSGAYNPQNNSIKVAYVADKSLSEYAILHEVGHALTVGKIRQYRANGTTGNATVDVAIKNLEKLQAQYREYIKTADPEGLRKFEEQLKKAKAKLPAGDFSGEAISKYYGAVADGGLEEFITMALSDEGFQNMLDSMQDLSETDVPKTLFEKLMSLIADLLGGITGKKLSDYTYEQAMTVVKGEEYTRTSIPVEAPVIVFSPTPSKQGVTVDVGPEITFEEKPAGPTQTQPQSPAPVAQQPGAQVEYTPTGKARQTYTVLQEGGTYKIFNKSGKEVFKTDSKDRRKIMSNYMIGAGQAVAVEIVPTYSKTKTPEKFIVFKTTRGIIKPDGDLLKLADNDPNIIRIREEADKKFGRTGNRTFLPSNEMVVDLGMDVTDFVSQLTAEERRMYLDMVKEGQIAVKCRI